MCVGQQTAHQKKRTYNRARGTNNNCRIKWSEYGTHGTYICGYLQILYTHRLINVSLEEFIVTVLHAHIFRICRELAGTVRNNRDKMTGPESDLVRNFLWLTSLLMKRIENRFSPWIIRIGGDQNLNGSNCIHVHVYRMWMF